MEDRLFDAIDEAFESIIFINYIVRSVQECLEEEYMMKNNIDFPILKTLDPLEERTSLKVKKMLQNGRMNYKAKRSSNELKAILKLFPNEPTDVAWCSGQKRNRSRVSSQPLVQMVKKAAKLEQTSADINKDAKDDLLDYDKPAGIDMANDLLSAVVDEEAKGDPQNMSLKIKSSLSLKLNWKLRLSIINEAAENLIYLNKQDSRVHGDLKASNILLDAEMNPKISDFGLAKENQSEVIKKSTINANRLLGCLVGSDKSRPREVAVDDDEHVRCQACQWTEALMKRLYAKVKSWLKISDFERLDEEYKKSGDSSSIPSYLDYVTKGIGRDIAARAILSDDILVLPCAFFYAVIDEMHNMKLKDINDEDVILKWGAVIRDAKKMRLDVEFAEEHLKKIAHAYFLSSKGGPAPAPAPAAEKISCSMSGAECFDDGAILSKGILFPPTNATPQTVVPKQEN